MLVIDRLGCLNAKVAELFCNEFAATLVLFVVVYFPFMLGIYSLVGAAESDVAIPFYEYFLFHHPGGQFMHGMGGGQDVGAVAIGSELVNVYSLLRELFPVWLAQLIEKFIIFLATFGGSYLLCRNVIGASPVVAAILAGIVLIAFKPFVTILGAATFAAPLVGYVCATEWSTRSVRLCAVAALLLGAMAVPPLNAASLVAASIFVPMILGRFNLYRTVIFCAALGLLTLLNWHEALYSWIKIMALSNRDPNLSVITFDILLKKFNFAYLYYKKSFNLFALISLIILMIINKSFRLKIFSGYVCFIAFGLFGSSVLILFGLGIFAIDWGQIFQLMPLISALLICKLLVRLENLSPGAPAYLVHAGQVQYLIGIAALSAVILTNAFDGFRTMMHAWNPGFYYAGVTNLAKPDWKADRPYRVVSLNRGTRLANIFGAFYGLDTFDGLLNIKTALHELYWSQIIMSTREKIDRHNGMIATDYRFYSFSENHLDISKSLSLPLLRNANVKYIISEEPLVGEGVLQVSGPRQKEPRFHFFNDNLTERLAYYRWRIERYFDLGELYIYDIGNALPRVYSPTKILTVPAALSEQQLIRFVETNATETTAVIRENDILRFASDATKPVHIRTYEEVVNGMEITLGPNEGGLVVVNFERLPFWRVYAAGRSLPIISVNAKHMGVRVPSGTQRLSFRYERGTAKDALRKLSKRFN